MRTVKIAKASKELTKKEKLAYQDTSDCISLDTAVEEATNAGVQFILQPKDYVLLDIHTDNPKVNDQQDYKSLVVINRDGKKYATGSNSFIEAFVNIFDTMAEDGDDEPYEINVVRKDSKNFKGKHFLTCNIVA